jgi:O-antigen/teichoic acid export membrane protein
VIPSAKTGEASGRTETTDFGADLTAQLAFIKKRASGSFAVKVLGTGVGFAVHLAIARIIGVAAYGIYALMLSWVSVLAVTAQFGQDNGVLHFLPKYSVAGQWGLIRGLRRGSGLLVLGSSLLISAVGVAYVHWHMAPRSVALTRTFDIGFLLLLVLAQLQQSGALHRALKQAAESDLYVVIVRPVALFFLIVFVYVLSPSLLTAPFATALSLISAAVALIFSALRLRTHWPRQARNAQPEYHMGAWLKVGAQLSVLSVMMVTSISIGSLVIGAFLGASRVGPYYAAVQIAGIASFGINAINAVLAPMIAEYYAAGRLEMLAQMMRRAARITFVATSVLTAGLAISGRFLLGLFGPGFVEAYVPLLILLVGEWLITCAGSVGFLLTMTRFQKQAPLIFLCGLVTNLILAAILVPVLGLTGMALSTVAGWMVWNLIALVFVYRRLQINPTVFQRLRFG